LETFEQVAQPSSNLRLSVSRRWRRSSLIAMTTMTRLTAKLIFKQPPSLLIGRAPSHPARAYAIAPQTKAPRKPATRPQGSRCAVTCGNDRHQKRLADDQLSVRGDGIDFLLSRSCVDSLGLLQHRGATGGCCPPPSACFKSYVRLLRLPHTTCSDHAETCASAVRS
jgi:hypothetical protein